MFRCFCLNVLIACALTVVAVAAEGEPVPEDFPRFIVPGAETEMASLRALFYQHYKPPAGPMATLWDEWMSESTLWPAVESTGRLSKLRDRWSSVLSSRQMDAEGYVATHQHVSIAHQQGWPFPFWRQGFSGTWGWHFALPGLNPTWHATEPKMQEAWTWSGCRDLGISDDAWNLELTDPKARVVTPALTIHPFQSPFIQLRWRADGLADAEPYLEWATEDDPTFNHERRFYFDPVTESQGMSYTMIPVFKSPHWQGRITRFRISFANKGSATVGIQALFTQYDTRHNVNNACFIRGCRAYFQQTGDLSFLRENIQRMRLAMRYMMHDLGGLEHKCIVTPFVGHDGLSGIVWEDGKKVIRSGHGIGNNYWDLLPMGLEDAYATMYYYDTLLDLASLERALRAHPEWNTPAGPMQCDPDLLVTHADEVKQHFQQRFWNPDTGRFVTGVDREGEIHDYGYTFMNCEAIYYDLASDAQAKEIMDWLTGERVVSGDTSQSEDIYHWRFAPRASTKRNIEWYGWFWHDPQAIEWGMQVQDGGAVLGFSYHDLMSRLKVLGPDDAWSRLQEITRWYAEVQDAGGYRAYYSKPGRGTLQGGGTAGGLGLDMEFFESILVPQVMLRGFMGYRPRADGIVVEPELPTDWPSLKITRIAHHDMVLSLTADDEGIVVEIESGRPRWPMRLYGPARDCVWECQDESGAVVRERVLTAAQVRAGALMEPASARRFTLRYR